MTTTKESTTKGCSHKIPWDQEWKQNFVISALSGLNSKQLLNVDLYTIRLFSAFGRFNAFLFLGRILSTYCSRSLNLLRKVPRKLFSVNPYQKIFETLVNTIRERSLNMKICFLSSFFISASEIQKLRKSVLGKNQFWVKVLRRLRYC